MKKLHIGCAESVLKGWDNLDIKPYPGIKYVQDASDLSNIKDDTYDKIYASDVIEHISWRKTRSTLTEWNRVLNTNGTMILETPSATELELILTDPNSSLLKQWDQDKTIFDYFCRLAYGHQDHEGNYHVAYFKEEWLREILEELGATEIKTVFSDEFRFRLEIKKW